MAYDSAEIFGALKACRGKVYVAAERLGCAPQTIKAHMAKNPEMAQYVKDCRASMVDKAEVALETCILNREHWAVALALKTLGKDRGYIERTEQQVDMRAQISGWDIVVEEEDAETEEEGESA